MKINISKHNKVMTFGNDNLCPLHKPFIIKKTNIERDFLHPVQVPYEDSPPHLTTRLTAIILLNSSGGEVMNGPQTHTVLSSRDFQEISWKPGWKKIFEVCFASILRLWIDGQVFMNVLKSSCWVLAFQTSIEQMIEVWFTYLQNLVVFEINFHFEAWKQQKSGRIARSSDNEVQSSL